MRSDYTSPDESLHELAQGRRAYGAHLMAERSEMGRSVVSEARLQGMEATARIEGFCIERLRGSGAVAIFNLMEDTATAEIARAQLWQWLHHADPRAGHAPAAAVLCLDDDTEVDFALFERALIGLPSRLIDRQDLPGASRINEAIGMLDRLTHADNLRAWLYRIATNTTFAFLKKRGRENGRLVEVDPELVEHGDGPAEAVMQRETLRELARAVDRLPARQQAALVLRNYQQMSYSEIASALNCSEEAARANVYQALKKLRSEVEGW